MKKHAAEDEIVYSFRCNQIIELLKALGVMGFERHLEALSHHIVVFVIKWMRSF